MTLDTYSHVLPSMGNVAASVKDEALNDGEAFNEDDGLEDDGVS